MKLVLKIASIGVLGLVLLVVALSLVMNPLLGKVLRAGVTRATGTETSLASVDLGLVSGRLELEGFAIANPEGFRDEPFLALDQGRVQVATTSLLGDTIEIPSIELSGVQLNVEAHGLSTNYRAILDHMQAGSGDEGGEGADDGPQKSLRIDRIVVTDIRCALHLDAPIADGSGAIQVPRVEIEDFASDGSTSHNVAKLSRALVEALLEAVLEEGGDLFPGEILTDLKGELGDLRATLEDGARGVIESIGDGAPLEKVGADVAGAAQEVGATLKGLFDKDGKKKKD
jgi:hypothetical protein